MVSFTQNMREKHGTQIRRKMSYKVVKLMRSSLVDLHGLLYGLFIELVTLAELGSKMKCTPKRFSQRKDNSKALIIAINLISFESLIPTITEKKNPTPKLYDRENPF